MRTQSEITNEEFFKEVEEFLNTDKIKGILFDMNLKSITYIFELNKFELSKPKRKTELIIEEKKKKTNERSLF